LVRLDVGPPDDGNVFVVAIAVPPAVEEAILDELALASPSVRMIMMFIGFAFGLADVSDAAWALRAA